MRSLGGDELPMEFHSLAPSPRRRRSTLMEGAPKPRSPERPQGPSGCPEVGRAARTPTDGCPPSPRATRDRKSTRLNSSHGYISYAVFCLKKKKKKNRH